MSRQRCGTAHLLGRERDGGEVEGVAQESARRCPSPPSSAAAGTRTSSRRISACRRVWSMVGSATRVSPALSAGTTKRLTPVVARSSRRSRATTISRIGDVSVDDEGLGAVQHEVAAVAPRHAPRSPLASQRPLASREGEGRDASRRWRSPGRYCCFCCLAAADEERVAGQTDGREERRAEQRRAHLLHQGDQLDVAESEPAVLLGNDDRRSSRAPRRCAATPRGRSRRRSPSRRAPAPARSGRRESSAPPRAAPPAPR